MKGAKLRALDGECLTIDQIDGGGACVVNNRGKSTHVALHVLTDEFKVAAAEQEILPTIAPSPMENYDMIVEQRRSTVRVALINAFDIASVGSTGLVILNRHNKAVFRGEGLHGEQARPRTALPDCRHCHQKQGAQCRDFRRRQPQAWRDQLASVHTSEGGGT